MTIKAKAWVGTESSSTLTLEFCAPAYLPGEIYTYTTKEGEKLTLYACEYDNKCCWAVGLGNDNSPAINPSYKGIITIPDEVEGMYVRHINSYAFKNCNLSGVTFPKHGLFLRIWGRAFQGCCNLKSIDIPSFVYLLSEAFIDCASLEEVHFDGYFLYFGTKSYPPYNQGMMFQGCNNIKKITNDHYPAMGFRDDTFTQSVYDNATLYVPSNSISTFKRTNGWKNFKTIKEIDTAYKGDLNGDGQTNGTDLVALSNIIIGQKSKTDSADVNNDGQVNGTDYVALVNIILGKK